MSYLPKELSRLFKQPGPHDKAPYVGVVGPPGSGKTRLLTTLAKELRGPLAEAEHDLVLQVDLSNFPVSDADSMVQQLANRLRSGAPVRFSDGLGDHDGDADAFDTLIDGILECTTGRVTLLLDNFDRLPRSFSRAVSRRFREFLEDRDRRIQFRRLSVVLAGAIDLLDLKREVDSAISLSMMFFLPWSAVEAKREEVEHALLTRGWEVDDELITRLVVETGGEPAFLGPVLRGFGGGDRPIPSIDDVANLVGSYQWICRCLPVLEPMLLAFCGDAKLCSVVHRLCDSSSGIPAGSSGEVDRLQLLGPVVVEIQGVQPVYRFRNSIVERFFRGVVAGIAVRVAAPVGGWSGVVPIAGVEPDPLFARAIEASRLRKEVESDRSLYSSVAKVRQALGTLTSLSECSITVLLVGVPDSIFVLDCDNQKVEIQTRADGGDLWLLVDAVRTVGQPYISLKRHGSSVALPLSGLRPAVLVASFSSSAVAAGFSEASVAPWSRWVASVRQLIADLAIRELGVSVVDGNLTGEEPVQSQTDEEALPLSTHASPANRLATEKAGHEGLRRLYWNDSHRELDRWRFAAVVLIALGVLSGVYIGWPFATSNIEILDQASTILAPVLSFVGFVAAILLGNKFVKLREDLEHRLVTRIYERRIRSAHLDPLLGIASPTPERLSDAGESSGEPLTRD